MKIEYEKAKGMLKEILSKSGANTRDIETMLELCVEEDLRGHMFGGFDATEAKSKMGVLEKSIGKKEKVVVDKPSLKLIDGDGRSAELVSVDTAIPALVSMAKTQGISIVGIYNSTYNGSLEALARNIADHDLIGIVTSNGGPQGVVPFGGKKDIFGTNPLAYAVPTSETPIAFDAATAQYAYGTIRIAKERGKTLPGETYFSADGEFTTDPAKAISLIPFGGYKGYAIVLLLEIMTGMMVQAKSGLDQKGDQSEIGSVLIAIDPAAFGDIKDFKRSATKLVKDIESVPAKNPEQPVRVPGARGEKLREQILSSGLIEVDDETWGRFESYYHEVV